MCLLRLVLTSNIMMRYIRLKIGRKAQWLGATIFFEAEELTISELKHKKAPVSRPSIQERETENYKLLHLNIQCLRNKTEELELCLLEISPDLLCICEHWLKKEEIEVLKLGNYNLATSFSRETYTHGGVAIYAKSSFACDPLNAINILSEEKSFECCAVKIKKINVIIISIYRSPDSDFNLFLQKFEELLNIISRHVKFELYICADFNINFFNIADARVRKFGDMLECYDLVTTITDATRVTNVSETLIDNIVAKKCNNVNRAECLDLMVSDHYGVLIHLNNYVPPSTHQKVPTKHIRSFSPQNKYLFRLLLEREGFSTVLDSYDVNQSYQFFIDTLLYCFDSAFPKKNAE